MHAHTYYVTIITEGRRAEARAASLRAACDYAVRVLGESRGADSETLTKGRRLINYLLAARRGEARGDLRTRIAAPDIGTIEVSMDSAPSGWTGKAGPKGVRTLFQSIPAGNRWK
jgi:hypothetical protein